jgi:hypothetical protein
MLLQPFYLTEAFISLPRGAGVLKDAPPLPFGNGSGLPVRPASRFKSPSGNKQNKRLQCFCNLFI